MTHRVPTDSVPAAHQFTRGKKPAAGEVEVEQPVTYPPVPESEAPSLLNIGPGAGYTRDLGIPGIRQGPFVFL